MFKKGLPHQLTQNLTSIQVVKLQKVFKFKNLNLFSVIKNYFLKKKSILNYLSIFNQKKILYLIHP